MSTLSLFANTPPIVILGDVMLDRYISGSVVRISPEAPVPVLRHLSEDDRLGGAANVALNIASISGKAHLLGVVGQDAQGDQIESMLQAAGITTDLVRCTSRHTTTKTRIMAGHHHQFLRIDQEQTAALPAETERALLTQLVRVLGRGAGGLILSDYAKGCLSDRVLQEAIALARQNNVPVFVDPKRADLSCYAGADFIKPNVSELANALNMSGQPAEAVIACASDMAHNLGTNILLTMSERGIALYAADGSAPILMPTLAQDVFDVSGAGDTVIAVFALMLANGMSLRSAMHGANVGAGLVVSKVGTATLTLEELNQGLRRAAETSEPANPPPCHSWESLKTLRNNWQESGLEVGFTNGCFDLLHPGHIRILRGAKAQCDRLIVGLNTDSSVRRLKGDSRPVQDELSRAEVLTALEAVDAVVLFDQETPLELIRTLEPDVLIKGADYSEAQIVGADVVKALGGRVARIELREGHSTSSLIARSKAGTGTHGTEMEETS